MTTTQTKTNGTTDQFDFEAWTKATRKAAEDSLDLYVKAVDQLAGIQIEAGRATKLPVIAVIVEKQAEAGRKVADAYVKVARDLLNA